MCIFRCLSFRTPLLSGVWLGVNLWMGTKKKKCWKKIGVHAQIWLTILDATINTIEWGGGVGPIWLFNNSKNLHFINEYDIHTNSKYNIEESGYGHNWICYHLALIVCFMEKNVYLRLAYFITKSIHCPQNC